jgi:hypothetical protein
MQRQFSVAWLAALGSPRFVWGFLIATWHCKYDEMKSDIPAQESNEILEHLAQTHENYTSTFHPWNSGLSIQNLHPKYVTRYTPGY